MTFVSRGGMGVVVRAVDAELGRTVAIKVLAPDLRQDESYVTRFLREARAIAALSHPNIVQIFDIQKDPIPFFTMEHLDGHTLDARLKERERIDLSHELAIAVQIARALECLHAAGIVHRDVKPENIVILADRRVKLIDFGLAKSRSWANVTQRDVILGTPRYMAPEVISGEDPTPAGDLFALGIVLFEMLTGRYPFPGTGTFPQMTSLPLRAETIAPGLPLVLDQLVRSCLSRSPHERPTSATVVRETLSAAVGKQGQ